jgi:uncharacterized protein (TIGR02391 family)
MLPWFLAVNRVLRSMRQKASDALSRLEHGDEAGAKVIKGYLSTDYQELRRHWELHGLDVSELATLGRHLSFGDTQDYKDMLLRDIAQVESAAERHAEKGRGLQQAVGFEELLHPIVKDHALHHYRDGHLREAVFNSIVAIFDLIRKRTQIDKDGAQLVAQAFSLDSPYLVFSEINTESGQNDQKGFLQILQGAYLGIRNPKAHSLAHDLDERKAAQYLIFASLLARRVDEAKATPRQTQAGKAQT